ncbi:hypothetical protein CDAR_269671 [Caerostris darwini]|uniref:Uncharacterized protein n=1 Tax=Caerostris darwini TaxID=1538125 RepID=A0AAV4SPH3_9ARAC|nr:hypothetical protein CDAR_269671 [Caerostris darwini]
MRDRSRPERSTELYGALFYPHVLSFLRVVARCFVVPRICPSLPHFQKEPNLQTQEIPLLYSPSQKKSAKVGPKPHPTLIQGEVSTVEKTFYAHPPTPYIWR